MDNNNETSRPCIYFAIGLHSRSSLDGFDMVYSTFQKKHLTPEKWDHALILAQTIPYPQELLERILSVATLTAIQFCKLDRDLGIWMGQQTNLFTQKNDIVRIDIVGSHGHTVFHDPSQGMSVQIGHPACIAAIIKKSVVGDFRSIDVALGGTIQLKLQGQGGPLNAIGDRLLYDKYAFCLDLGGVANITYLNPNNQATILSYDICVCTQLLGYIQQQLNSQHQDSNGIKLQSGIVNNSLLDSLNDLQHHTQPSPKFLHNSYLNKAILPIFDQDQFKDTSLRDKLVTSVTMIVGQVAKIIQETQSILIKNNADIGKSIYLPKQQIIVEVVDSQEEEEDEQQNKAQIQYNKNEKEQMKVLVSGEGALNIFLMDSLQNKLQELGVLLEQQPTETKFKEAMNFGFLAVLRIRKEINIMKSVTGSQSNSVGGCVYYHDNL